MNRLRHAGLVAASLLLTSAVLPAQPPDHADYARLFEAHYRGPVEVPPGQITWQIDDATWTLLSGQVWLLEPTASGTVTGMVFEGTGRFEMPVPDRFELEQLTRFANDPELETIDQNFSKMIVRTSTPEHTALFAELTELAASASDGYTTNELARQRHRGWIKLHGHDADARVIAALRTFGDRYLRAEMKFDDFGWVTYSFDSLDREEVRLVKHRTDGRVYPGSPFRTNVAETWLSLDRREERDPDGRPSGPPGGSAELTHVEAHVDLTRLGRGAPQGFGEEHPIQARLEVATTFVARRTGTAALLLRLHPMAELESVHSDRAELSFLRYNTGQLELSLDDRLHNYEMVVLLDRTLEEGESIVLDFVYELEVSNYGLGSTWYPTASKVLHQPHTADLSYIYRPYYEVMSSGERIERTEADRRVTSQWRVEEPTKMVTFAFGRYAHSRRFESEGLPPVTLFGTRGGYMSATRIDNLAHYITDPLDYFHGLFGRSFGADELMVTLISGQHGQAFRGLLHVGDFIAKKGALGLAVHGTKDLFVAHEVAHQWWGHEVGWQSYRDQWLSEAFAEYSAMMYVEASIDEGPKVFRDILSAYTNELNGSLRGSFNAFARPGVALLNRQGRKRIGPIGHGFRSAIAEAPTAPFTMAYRKGSLVLHMIRVRLRTETGSDQAFVDLLRAFLDRHNAEQPTTDDLKELLAEHLDIDWDTFFDQWVGSTRIPKLQWSHQIAGGEHDGWRVELEVEKQDVPSDFQAPVLVRVTLEDGDEVERYLSLDEELNDFSLPFEVRPVRVALNPDHSLIAKMNRRPTRPTSHPPYEVTAE